MKKVLVIGSGGAGKSTFARKLGEAIGIEVIHLDTLYWRPGWVKTDRQEWERTVERLLACDSWIMDGNYGGTREMRMQACDTVIFLDVPRSVCLYRILKRSLLLYGKTRPDMAEGCNEKFDLEFVQWVWTYPNRARVRVMKQFREFEDKEIIILRRKKEIALFLQNALSQVTYAMDKR
jgi:adenylate kinase family enzyme